MIDKATFYLVKEEPEDFGEALSVTIGDIILEKTISVKSHQVYYLGYYKGLRLSLYATSLYISNSISTFRYGHNFNDISYNQLKKLILKICRLLSCTTSDLRIRNLEFGFTIPIKKTANRIMLRLLSHKNTEAKQEFRNAILVALKFYHHNYNYKVYDKNAIEKIENGIKIPGNWIRIEQQFKAKHLKNIKTAEDLLQPENLQIIFDEFLKQWKSIKKFPFLNHNDFNQQELYRMYSLMNPVYIEDRGDYIRKDSVKKEQQRFKRELESIGDYLPFKEIENMIIQKFRLLLFNENVPEFLTLLLKEKRGQLYNIRHSLSTLKT